MIVYRVFNSGEIPPLAHGWRSVVTLPPGRKWITLIDWTTLETARMEIAAWERLRPRPDGEVDRRKVRAFMRRRIKYKAATRAIEEAIHLLKETSP